MTNTIIAKTKRRTLPYFLGLSIVFMLASCDFILKDKDDENKQNTIETSTRKTIAGEEDEHGCTYTAGYRWSVLSGDCIRVFEKGFRLNPISLEEGSNEENELEDNDVSCFVLLSEDKQQAEIFLPNVLKSIVLANKNIEGLFSNDGWELDTRKKMILSKNGELKFTAAKAIEIKVISPNQLIEEEEE